MKEPLSTISNLAYAVAGWLALSHSADAHTVTYALTALVLCGGSIWYHGALGYDGERSRDGQGADEVAMYAHLASLALIGTHPVFAAVPWIVLLAGWAYRHGIDSMKAVPALTAVVMAVLIARAGWMEGLSLAGVMIAAVSIRLAGEKIHRWHEPLHAIWHLLTAAATYSAWSYLTFGALV